MGMFEDVIAQSAAKRTGFSGVLTQGRRHLPTPRVARSSMTTSLWELEFAPANSLNRLLGDLESLTANTLDSNIFFEPDVVKSAWPRLTSQLAPHGAWMVCLWETMGELRKMRLFMPVRLARTGLPKKTVMEPLSNDFMPIGTPLVDAECAGEALEMLLRLLADPQLEMPPVFDFTHQITGTQTYGLICEAAQNLGLPTRQGASHERAALFSSNDLKTYPDGVLPRKRVRDYARQLRRLKETGSVSFHCARTEEEVLDAFEDFITLELRSWKGRRGTALYNQKNITSFSRQIVAEMAVRRRSEIFSMSCGNTTIASLIMLGRDGHLVPWKMAYDEALNSHSPGVQVMLYATAALLKRKSFKSADSLAVSDHWMMNRLWPDRLTVTDLSVQLRTSSDLTVDALVKAKARRRKLVGLAKSVLAKIR